MSSSDELVATAVFASTLNLAAAIGSKESVSRNLIPVRNALPPPPPPKGTTQPQRFAVSGQPSTLMTTSVVGQDSSQSLKPPGKDSQPRELLPPPPITFVSVRAHPNGEYPGGDTFHTLFAQIRAFQGELNSSKNIVMFFMTYLENIEKKLSSVLSYYLPNSEKEPHVLIDKIRCYQKTVSYHRKHITHLHHFIRLTTEKLDSQLLNIRS